jgi:hypothetical protein
MKIGCRIKNVSGTGRASGVVESQATSTIEKKGKVVVNSREISLTFSPPNKTGSLTFTAIVSVSGTTEMDKPTFPRSSNLNKFTYTLNENGVQGEFTVLIFHDGGITCYLEASK